MEPAGFLSSFLKMIFALSIVLGIMVAAAYFFRRFLRQPLVGGDDGSLIQVVATKYLGPKNSIMLVDVLGELIVVGVSNNQMSVITTIVDPDARERMKKSPLTSQQASMPTLMDQFLRYKNSLKSFKSAGKDRQGP
jgi:flagellar protein FliO/FliZ